MERKVCPKCGRLLPVDAFNKSSKHGDGLQCWCRECQRENYEANKDKPRKPRPSRLAKYTDDELMDEMRRRSKVPLVNPTPRGMMEALAKMGYRGKLEYTQVHVIDINNF